MSRTNWKTAKVATFGVLAGAYVDQALKVTHSHLCETDGDASPDCPRGYPIKVACSGAKIDNICPDGYSEAELDACPSCPACAAKWQKRQG